MTGFLVHVLIATPCAARGSLCLKIIPAQHVGIATPAGLVCVFCGEVTR